MTTFDDRERAFETKFAHDEEMKFRVIARRNKLLGHWAAGLMKLSVVEAESYAKDVVRADFEEAGDEDVFRKVSADLKAKGLTIGDDVIRQKMAALVHVANEQIADIQVKSQRQLYVFGKAGGETTVYASNGAGDIISVPFVMLHYTAGTVHVVKGMGRADYSAFDGVLPAKRDELFDRFGNGGAARLAVRHLR